MEADISNEYVIVEFPNEKKKGSCSTPMALISSKWIHEKDGILQCWWPTYISNPTTRAKSVKFHYDIDKSKSISCCIVVKYNSGDYEDALEKIKILEIESEIESELEDDSREKAENLDEDLRENRTNLGEDSRKKKIFRSEDFEYELSDLEAENNEPRIPRPKPNLKKTPQNIKSVSEIGSNVDTQNKTYHSISNVASAKQEKIPQKTYHSLRNVATASQEIIYSPKPYNSPNTSQEKNLDGKIICGCDKNFAILTKILKEIQQMKTAIDNLSLISVQEDPLGVCDLEIPKADCYEDLKTLESKLSDQQFHMRLQKRLALIGGKDSFEVTRNILSVLISHPLALTMNFSGKSKDTQKQKSGLMALEKVLGLIIAAVRSNDMGKNATDKEIQNTIMNWFRTATDREGGRVRRLKVKTSE